MLKNSQFSFNFTLTNQSSFTLKDSQFNFTFKKQSSFNFTFKTQSSFNFTLKKRIIQFDIKNAKLRLILRQKRIIV